MDYSLFILARYREEVRARAAPDLARRTAMQTSGLAVVFSSVTVLIALAGLERRILARATHRVALAQDEQRLGDRIAERRRRCALVAAPGQGPESPHADHLGAEQGEDGAAGQAA